MLASTQLTRSRREKSTLSSALAMPNPSYDFPLARTGVAYANYWLKEEIQKSLPNTSLAGGAAVYECILNGFYDQITVVTGKKP
jgi:acid phosphatase type 7